MKKFNGYDEAKKNAEYKGTEKLPAGAYCCKVVNVKYTEGNGTNDYITLLFDVSDGDYKNFFKKQYDENQNEDKKWKGRVTIWVPSDDGTEKDGWTKNSFAKWTNSLEASNPGYSWDWDEKKWKGKNIGLVFREAGKNIEGKNVVFTEVAFPVSISDVKEGKTKAAKFKAYSGYNATNSSAVSNDFVNAGTDSGADEIPFD